MQIKGLDGTEVSEAEVRPKVWILEPFLHQASLALVYAPAGVGKSLFCFGLGVYAALGRDFLSFTASKAWRTLYIDGEMTLGDSKERIDAILSLENTSFEPGYFTLVTQGQFPDGMIPSIVTPEGKSWFMPLADSHDVIIIDNLGCVAPRASNMTDEQAWISIAPMLVKLRNRGKAIVIVHHAGKSGEQLGTSLKTQVLDYSISLQRPVNAAHGDTAFYLHWEKIRGKHRKLLKPLYCRYEEFEGVAQWHYQVTADFHRATIIEMSKVLKPHEIAEALRTNLYFVKSVLKEHEEKLERLEMTEQGAPHDNDVDDFNIF